MFHEGENYLLKGEKEKMKIEEKGKEWISVKLSSSPPERKDLLFRWGSLIRVYNLSRGLPEALDDIANIIYSIFLKTRYF